MTQDVKWFNPELGTPVVSVSRTGLTFNAAGVAVLSNASYVQIGVKPEAHSIVVRAAEHAQGTLPFYKEDTKNRFVRISSKDLVRFLSSNLSEIDLTSTTKYLARAEDSSLIIDVRQALKPRKRNR